MVDSRRALISNRVADSASAVRHEPRLVGRISIDQVLSYYLLPITLLTHIDNMASAPAFEQAINVQPISSHRYSVDLKDDWCIGTVPHGGYTTAVLYRLAIRHFAHTHPKRYTEPATPIAMQLAFLRRTASGPAVLKVSDAKIGARTSTIHVSLLQTKDASTSATAARDEDLEVKITGYITVSPGNAEEGISSSTGWELYPAMPRGSGVNGVIDFANLANTGTDGAWKSIVPPFPKFRRAAAQIELYGADNGPAGADAGPRVVDQWARFRPGGDKTARWSNEAVAYLVDMFPMALDGFDTMSAAAEGSGSDAKFWYPTVTLNIDFKKRLPAAGTEWLYSRVQTKVVRDGRTDLDVTVLDEAGEVVALSTQVGLVVSAARNVGKRALKSKM